ncbi:uncharacterized protein LACBIDRAFT_298942 [Laccaria bicolor S238N-H82]|uniref:AA9 family lytic polysaccharide monooxygenase n=1 Tax=Laccaria bicolor (strain S238N-H82 / ATCC MYA-4686) TaxID=486041 RepID=B0DDN1_LACBS|nr:uncharacterized protein LACBIDRAFT_298942 [Laccaria bicolor S238N-H82]EDR07117.1 predicted protein [Laccaria bicolor S238N-H82]|eukprot:XP_001882048.1 predicted protein [Laccaria bicolor S238N-H82]
MLTIFYWPHNTGPMLTYLASCGSTTCDNKPPNGLRSTNIQLPSNLAPGNYLVCHEVIAFHIALHLATSLSGAEFRDDVP